MLQRLGAICTVCIAVASSAHATPAPVLTRAPELLEAPSAHYPPDLLSENLAGEALLVIDIDAEGAVERVQVESATRAGFGSAALDAACQFRFSPAYIDDAPGAIRIEYRTHFAPQELPPAVPAEKPILLRGLVREAGTRAPVMYASIQVGDRVVGTQADGTFEMRDVPEGSLAMRVSHPDYEPYQVVEDRRGDQRLEVKYYLVRRSRSPYETVVRSKADRREVAKIELTRDELQKVPGTFGDPIRVLENLPGMGRAPVLGGQLLVRGANPQDTQVLVDGMPIPILYHFFALTSVVNAEFLDRIDFYPGGFGARYGRATAGVVDIVTRDITCDLWHGAAKVDFIDSAAYTCVPVGSWNIAGAARRSYIDALLPLVIERLPREPNEGVLSVAPVYWDYQSRARTALSGHVIDISVFGSNDTLRVIQTGSLASLNLSLGVTAGFHRLVLRDRWRLADKMTLTSTVSPSYQYQRFDTESTEVGLADNIVADAGGVDWREDFSMELLPHLQLNAGLDNTFGAAGVSLREPKTTELQTFPSPTFDYTNSQNFADHPAEIFQAYWAELVYDAVPGLRLVPGIRFEDFYFGITNVFLVLPRFTARWEFWPGSTVKAAYGMYARLPDPQNLLPSFGNPDLTAERSQQFIVGIEQTFPELISLDVQAFYNLRYDLTAPSKSINLQGGSAVPQLYANSGTGYTYGLEVLLRRLPSPETHFYGWIAYTLSRSERRDHGVGSTYFNGNQTVPYSPYDTELYLSPFDQTHILTIIGQWVLPAGFEAGFRFRLVSGNPVTPVRQGHVYWDGDADAYGDNLTNVARNSDRLPAFHQLDVRVERQFVFDLWRFTAYLEVINAYFAKNIEAYQYDYRYRGRVGVTLLPILPVLGVKGEF